MDLFGQADAGDPMSWVKLATDFMWHPKALAAGPEGRHLYQCSLMWSGHYGMNGGLPAYALPVLATSIGVATERAQEIADKLVEVGLWERSADGWEVHDWLDWQEDAEVRKAAKATAARKRQQLLRSKRSGLTQPLTLASEYLLGANADQGERNALDVDVDVDVDVEIPPPTPPKGGEQPFEQEFAKVWTLYPRKLNRKAALRAYSATRRRGVPAADLLLATEGFVKAMAAEGREWRLVKHGSTFFGPDEPWQDYLPNGPGLTEGGSGATIDRIAAARERLRAEHEALSGR